MMETLILTPKQADLEKAGEIIRRGGLVAFPTETVYGLGADAFNDAAVKNIFKAKGRPGDNPLIVHVADKKDIGALVSEIPPKAQALIDAFFPAPLTVIMKKSAKIPESVSAGLDTVGVRMPENETARAFIAAAGVPIAAPSANRSGRPSPTSAKYVAADLGGRVDAVIDGGACSVGVESTVISLAGETPVILRPGAVTKEQIESVIGEVLLSRGAYENIEIEKAPSPGMKYQHYAPKAKVVLVKGSREKYEKFVNSRQGAFALCFEDDTIDIPKVTYGVSESAESQAQQLFSALRRLDELGAAKAYARLPEQSGVGAAVYNRLLRAAAFRVIDLEKPFLIGLSGQTGAGKAYVGQYLKTLGFNIADADDYARRVLEREDILSAVQREFGADIIKDGKADRRLLAERAFAGREKTARLNAIMHPAVLSEAVKGAAFPCVFDAPLLFESGGEALCEITVSVLADEKTRLSRIMKRDKITESEALARMKAQHTEEFYIKKSDCVVINDGRDIKIQIDKILEERL